MNPAISYAETPLLPDPQNVRKFGYARVSTEDQDLRHQLQALRQQDCFRIFEEKESGASLKRPQFDLLRKFLRPGDTLVVTKLDRLGRNLVELEALVTWLESNQIELACLYQPVDFKSANGRMMFRMMAAFAQMESELTSERTKKGIEAARAVGRQIGAIPKRLRWEKEEPEKANQIVSDCLDDRLSMNAIARKYGITNATLRKNWGEELRAAGKMKRK